MQQLDFDTDGRDWPNRDASRFVVASGFRWHVQTLGDGPTLLLVHGTGASTHSWRAIVPLLARHFTLVMPDLPGHGFTAYPPISALSLPGMAASLGALTKTLGVEPALVAGHSAGAAVLIRMTIDRLIAPKAIISINGALLPFGGIAGQLFSPLAKLMFLNPFIPRIFAWRAQDRSAVARVLRDTGSDPSPEDIDLYARLFSSPPHCASALGMMARWDLDTFERGLPALQTKVTLIASEKDRAVTPDVARRVAAKLPVSETVVLPGAGHLAHEEQPEEVARVILATARSAGILGQ